jgi:signal transduction histidine kinase
MPSDSDKSRIIPLVLIGFITAASVVAAISLGKVRSHDIRNELQSRSLTIASAIDPDTVMKLKGTAADAKTPAYGFLKERLAAIKKANKDVRSIYLTGKHGNQLFFYVDSEQPGSRDYSPAAERYDDASTAFKNMFTNGQPLVEGPVTDNFGTFISGLAPVKNPDTDKVIAVVGIDIASETYWRNIALAAALPAIIGLCLIIIVGIFEWLRRRNIQLLAVRSELVSVASHELRTPIVGIKWGAESLEKIITDEKALPYVRAIRNSAVSLQASADDILELTYAINNRKVALAPVNVTKLVQEVFDTQELSAQQKNVTLNMDESLTPELTIDLDAEKIKRVLHNMVSNAIKYTRNDTTVTVAYQQDDKTHRILISDQGIGIPPTEQGKVLQGFYRASNAIASKVQGTGLGLYLVKTVLEQHGGKVTFISEENKGTTFTLSLPKNKK